MLTNIYYPSFPKACKEIIVKNNQPGFEPRSLKQSVILQSVISVFVYFKVSLNLKYSMFNYVCLKKDVQLTYNCYREKYHMDIFCSPSVAAKDRFRVIGPWTAAIHLRRAIPPRKPQSRGRCPFSPTARKYHPSGTLPLVRAPDAKDNRVIRKTPGVRNPPGTTLPTHLAL